ncbi:acyltransferase, WS/DGAT/MGAT [Mesorhizobium albiziae]|uniref:diacylglycerol O-acyltransferase n=1 Tax=Neomesorhizobium albiziae TaxID=335020 RepID=A0A1I3V3T6_9HYPH|nr:wax ester/triacylglycerol synthase family O-acyltransferase [Mesorhizobium albiziae]GLS28601.1 diacylglycerol O-acyltransferase [Mesorhizobium albiziae]SFJ89016.1 acyltransferase, WS/DGAT/MGAT [Mesorhizobium albiziae]
MKQLGGIDATFLYMETPETPMHVAGLTLYEPPENFSGSFFEHFKEFFLTRIHLAPIFEKKLARTVLELDHPLWVDAGELDLDYHLRRATLPSPGSWRQLEELVGDLHSVPLDRTQPLWQFTIIEGLDDGNVAIYSKVHHAAIDGGAGMAIAAALYDMSPVPRKVKPPLAKKPVRKPSIEERAILGINDAVQNVIRQQLNVMQAIPQVLGTLTDMLAPPKSADGKPSGGSGIPAIPDVLAPKTPFNVTITSQRSYAARALSLTDAKTVSKATGTKINDVVMAVCAGALRPYLQGRKALPKKPLVAFVPISLREPGNADASNQVFGMLCPIATQIEEPLERLKSIQKTTNDSKSLAGTVKDVSPKDFTLLGAPILLPGLAQLYGRTGLADLMPSTTNLTISNVPGPPFPLYCAGAKILAMYPVSIPVHGIALNITVQSYQDKLNFAITADRRAVPDPQKLADLFEPALEELTLAVASLAGPARTAGKNQPSA